MDVTVKSVLQADVRDVELLLINDASTDETPAVMEQWAERDDRVRLIHLPVNRGIGEVRNLAVDEARGDFFAYVDADDWVTRDYHRVLIEAVEQLGVDFVKSDHVRVTGVERTVVRAPEVHRGVAMPPTETIAALNRATMIDYGFVWPGVYRRSFLVEQAIDCGSDLRTAEDRVFTWKVHLRGQRYACISEAGYLYRKEGTGSLTGIGDARQLGFLDCIAQTLELLTHDDAAPHLIAKAYRQALALVVFHFDRRERFSPDVWYTYSSRCQQLLEAMDAAYLRGALEDFGERRVLIVEALRSGGIPILDPTTSAEARR